MGERNIHTNQWDKGLMPLLLVFFDQVSVFENPHYRLDEWYESSKIRPKFCNVDDLEEDI